MFRLDTFWPDRITITGVANTKYRTELWVIIDKMCAAGREESDSDDKRLVKSGKYHHHHSGLTVVS